MLNSASLLIVPILLLTTLLMTAGQTIAQTPTPKLSGKFLNSQLATPDNIIGIGTTAPYQNVQGNVNISGETHLDPDDTSNGTVDQNTTTSVLKFGGILSGEGITSKRTAGGEQYGLNFYTNSLNRLTILNDGKIGVGTVTPTSLFSIGASSQFQVDSSGNLIKINNIAYSWPSAQGAASTVLTNNGSGTLTWAPSSGGGSVGPGTANYVSKFNAAGNNVINSQIFDNGTNVGIGSNPNPPAAKLHVYSPGTVKMTIQSGVASYAGINFITSTIRDLFEGINPDSSGWYIYDNKTAATRLYLGLDSGNFGVNTSTPNQKLTVNGNFGIIGSAGGTNVFQTSSAQPSATTITYTLPTNGGAANQVLTTNGTGTLSWTTPSGGSSGYNQIQDKGTNLTQRTTLNFAGAGVTCIDNAGSTRTDCTIPGGGGSLPSGTINQTLRHDGTTWVANSFLYNNGTAVGINTTSPAAGVTLDVNGKAKMTGFQLGSATTSGYVLTADASGNGTWQAPPVGGGGSLPNGTAAGQTPYWNGASWQVNGNLTNLGPSGNIGIGTVSPGAKVQINAPATTEALRLIPDASTSPLNIRNSGNTADIFRVDQSGILQVGSVPWARLTSFPPACTAGQFVTQVGSTLTCATPPAGGGGLGGSGTLNYVAKFTPNGVTLGNSQIFDNGTSVGVGTASPNQKLSVAGSLGIVNGTGTNVFQTNGAQVGTVTYTLPTSAGSSNQVLTTNGTGTLSWTTPSGGSSGYNQIQDKGTNLTQRTTLNFAGAGVNCVDDGINKTNCTIPGGGSLPSGTSGQTLRHDGTNWIANSNIFNNGTNVGIGTATPEQTLEVNGRIGILPSFDNYSYIKLGNSLTGEYIRSSRTSNNIIFGTGSFDRVTLSNSGILGLNTTTPGGGLTVANLKMDVNGATYNRGNIYSQTDISSPYVVAFGELRAAIADWPTKSVYGIGWDSLTPGGVGVLMPGGNIFGFYGYTGSNRAGIRVTGMSYLNQSVELGSEDTTANTPFVDFHFIGSGVTAAQDYNARIINDTNNSLIVTTRYASDLGKNVIRLVNDKVGFSNNNPAFTVDVSGDVNATRLCIGGVCQASWPSGGGAVSSVGASNTTLTISPTSGAVLASLNLANANTWTGAQTFSANTNFPGSGIWNTFGNLGVGTISPAAKLDVNGTAKMTGFQLTTTPTNGYVLTSDASGVGSWQQASGAIGGSGTVNYIPKYTPNGTTLGSSRIYEAAATGYTGIATTNPTAQLDVVGTFKASGASSLGSSLTVVNNLTVDANNSNNGTLNNFLQFGGTGAGEGIVSKRTAGGNQWGLDFYTASTNRVSITSAGFVGIGTPAPIATLDIYTPTQGQGMRMTGPNTYAAIFSANLAAGNFNPITQLNDGGIFFGKGLLPDDPAMGGFVIGPWSNTLGGLRIDKTGNVSIGTANAQGKKLYVLGDATFTGAVLYGTAGPISDARLKKNIQPLENALEKVLKLEGVSFEFDQQKDPNLPKGQNIGFIAQGVEPIVPEVVRTDSRGYKSVLYENLTALLVEAVKDLNNKISTIFTKLTAHDNQLTKQQQMIDAQAKQIEKLQQEVELLKAK